MRRTLFLLTLFLAAQPAWAWVAVLPGAVEGLGQAPAVFSSTVYLANLEPYDAAVTFQLIPYARTARTASGHPLHPANGSLVLEEALKTLFDISADAGTLLIYSDRPLTGSIVTANVANPAATYGVALSPVSDRELLRIGDSGHAPWVSQGGGFRTNVAAVLVEPDSSVVVSVYDASGASRGPAGDLLRGPRHLAGSGDGPHRRARPPRGARRVSASRAARGRATSL